MLSFTAQSTHWGQVEQGQFVYAQFYWAGLVLLAVYIYNYARYKVNPYKNLEIERS